MKGGVLSRFKSAWNVFYGRTGDEDSMASSIPVHSDLGYASSFNPYRYRLSPGADRTIIATVTNRIALDVASFDFRHVRLNEEGRYLETVDSDLNQCLELEANIDQTGRAFIQDIVMSMFDEGVVAIVPVETSINPVSGAFKIFSMRTAKILEWYPGHVRVEMYNEFTGIRQVLVVPKSTTAIIENPLYAIMNEQNSTLKRLVRKLSLLDIADDKTNAGKLDLIIQLPYTVRSDARQKQAEERIKSISRQMESSQYGIAYADATERITQLNRPVDNNLLTQIQYLTNTFYNQLGLTESVFSGNASEQELKNYYDRTVEPIVTAIVEELKRKFLTKTARTQGHSLMAFRDVFRLVPATELANVADVLSRNEILTPNEWRQILGYKPSENPRADDLTNKNMPASQYPAQTGPKPVVQKEEQDKKAPETREEIKMEIDRLKREMSKAIV